MTSVTWAYASFFAVWLLLSIVVQFQNERITAFRQFDSLHLLPTWTFFAPNPGRTDYHVIVRDRLPGGKLTAWEDALPIPQQALLNGVWNPQKRQTKVVGDAVASIIEAFTTSRSKGVSKESIEEGIIFYGPYLLIVSIVLNSAEHHKDASAFQFAIIERFGFGRDAPPRPVLLSRFHSLR